MVDIKEMLRKMEAAKAEGQAADLMASHRWGNETYSSCGDRLETELQEEFGEPILWAARMAGLRSSNCGLGRVHLEKLAMAYAILAKNAD